MRLIFCVLVVLCAATYSLGRSVFVDSNGYINSVKLNKAIAEVAEYSMQRTGEYWNLGQLRLYNDRSIYNTVKFRVASDYKSFDCKFTMNTYVLAWDENWQLFRYVCIILYIIFYFLITNNRPNKKKIFRPENCFSNHLIRRSFLKKCYPGITFHKFKNEIINESTISELNV